MTTRAIAYVASAVCLLCSTLNAQQITRLDIRSTSVVRRTPAGERQILHAIVSSASELAGVKIRVGSSAGKAPLVLSLEGLRKGENAQFLEIPVVRKSGSALVELVLNDTVLCSQKARLTPPRRRKVYDVQVSHHDLGYADYYHFMRRDVREMGIEMALEYCRRTDAWERPARFHWTVETSEPMTRFISSQPPRVVQELASRIREGRIELGGLHSTVYTEMMGYELMARLFYTPNRHIVDLLGVPPRRTALIDDVVGFTRTLSLFLKEADVPYFYHGYNETIEGLYPASANPVFYWGANDGDRNHRPLFRSFPYYSPDRLTKHDLPEIVKLLEKYDADPRWTYDCLIAEDSYDFSLPRFENVEGIRKWNQEYSNPLLVSGTFTMFFDDVVHQADTSAIPVYDEDAPDAWADQDGSDARLQAGARQLNYELPTIEKLSTLAFASGGKGYPWKEIWQSYHKLLTYHEHTDGAFSEEDILPIPLQKDTKAANANYYQCEQVMHKGLVKEARMFADAAREHAVGQFAHLISAAHESTLVVFNPLSFARSDIAVIAAPPAGSWIVIDNASGKAVPSQRLPDGRLIFAAGGVPSMGYRTYRLIAGRALPGGGPSPSVRGGILENEFYRLAIDSVTGALSSLFDRRRGLELVDRNAPYRLNEYIYQRIEDPVSRVPVTHHPCMVSCTSFQGALAAGITTNVSATGCASVEQTTMLYANSDRIDVVVRLDKSPSGRLLKQTSTENKEALFYALPFDVPGFTIRHELAGGVVEPLAHQFRGSTSNFFAVQHFTDIANGRYGVTLSTVDAPLLEYGTPRPALWNAPNDAESIIRKPDRSHVYLYLMNNMFFTNIPISQPGEATFRWSIRSHDGDWRDGKASRFGWETSHPLEVFMIGRNPGGALPDGSHSFLSVDKENVLCTTVKPAEANGEGLILRFFELAGRRSDVRARVNFSAGRLKAEETNLVEADRHIPLAVAGNNEIRFSVRPFGVKTIRLLPVERRPIRPPAHLGARALSDREVLLSWDGSAEDGTSFYRVYRGTTPGFTPAPINCVAAVTSPPYTDGPVLNHGGWLDNRPEPGTTYYYRVEAVGHDNTRGPASGPVEVKTLLSSERNSVPKKVLGLEATDVSPVSDFNYICLLFYTNTESDVTRYRVYRGENSGFRADSASLLAEIDATQKFRHVTPHGFASVTRELREYSMIVYPDESARPNRQYYYRVCAVDEADQAGELSDEVAARSDVHRIRFEGSTVFYDSAAVDIRPVLDDGGRIRYTLGDGEVTAASPLYTGPFTLREPATVRAALFPPDPSAPAIRGEAVYRRSLYPPPRYLQPYSEKWPGEGVLTLVDGRRGSTFSDGRFQGFEFNDMDVVVSLGGAKDVQGMSVTMLQDIGSWIFFPVSVEFSVSSDGTRFENVGQITTVNEHERMSGSYAKEYAVSFENRRAGFVRVHARNVGMCPPWHIGYFYKGKAWLFTDEIVVR
jgi:hypothetical protein